jgi:hypothetical protein
LLENEEKAEKIISTRQRVGGPPGDSDWNGKYWLYPRIKHILL